MTTPMIPHRAFTKPEPTRAAIDALREAVVLEFGTDWCGHCRAAQPLITEALSACQNDVNYIRVDDGPGRPLGRSFRVKLWPSLIFLQQGQERARLVRPGKLTEIVAALTQIGVV